METIANLRQSNATFRPIVAFDFDGTLTCKDSFTAFLAWRAGAMRYGLGMLRLVPEVIRYGCNRDRGRLKAAVIGEFLRGVSRQNLENEAGRFAGAQSLSLLRPDAVRCWRDWRERGAHLVIVTASPEILIAPFADVLGADHLIGTRLALDDQQKITGALDGPNCRGAEKVKRLAEAYGEDFRLVAAYGDSAGDREMLTHAEQPRLRVFALRP